MRWTRAVPLVAAAALACLAAREPAHAAQGSTDYTVTLTSGLYETPPSNATPVNIATNATLLAWERVDLPFTFPYFGVIYDHVFATCGGYLQFIQQPVWVIVGAVDPSTVPALSGGNGINNADGACAALWEWIPLTSVGRCVRWTAGTAPNRRVIVSWEGVNTNSSSSARVTFQIKLFEGTGVIEFAYAPDVSPSTWTGLNYSVGMVATGADPRWVVPENTSITNQGHPAYDYRFTPRTVRVQGRVLYDRLTPTSSGLGTATTPADLAGLRVEVRNSDGTLNAVTTADDSGSIDVTTLPGNPDGNAALFAYAAGKGCSVVPFGTSPAPAKVRVTQGIGFAGDVNLGTLTINDAVDPNAAFRTPANVACAIERAYRWAAARTQDTIPQIAVTFDPSVSGPTTYTYAAAGSPATLRVSAGPSLATLDAWDDGVIQRAYGVHVLAAISAPPSPLAYPQFDPRFDAVSDQARAFATGFGCYLHAVVDGKTRIVDSTSASTAVVDDLETPWITVARGADVSGCVAGALFDLADAANESRDWTDGTTSQGATPFLVLDSMQATPTASRFAGTWVDSGLDSRGLSRTFVDHGLLADDASEPNDDRAEATLMQFGSADSRRDGLVLNVGNDDWFAFDLASPATDLRAEVNFVRLANIATIEVQVLNSSGQLVAGKLDATLGPAVVVAGAVPAGSYLLRVHHVSGHTVPAYTAQVFDRLTIDRTPLPSWTQGFAYDRTIPAASGIPPHAFKLQAGALPPGLLLNGTTGRIAGTPGTPGAYDFTVVVEDGGDPVHSDLVTHHVDIAEPLSIDLGEFVGFAAGRTIDVTRAHVGGTRPLTVALTAGALPAGLSVAEDDLRFVGTPSTPGSTRFSLDGADVVGSASSTSPTAVVCVAIPTAKSPVALAAGASACGFFFDAVAGSTASIAVATAPKQAKRALRMVVLGPDGRPVAGGKVRPGKGRASAASVPAPVTGRYFAIVAAGDEGAATQLLGTLSVKPPAKGSGTAEAVAAGSSVEFTLGALAGARFELSVKPARKSGLTVFVGALIDPSGASVPLDGLTSAKGSATRLATTLNASGTWTVRLRTTGGEPGNLSWSYKLKEPKGVVFEEP